MNEKEVREILDNMSEQELNDFIFFALKEVEKENQKLKTELKKKDKIIDLMGEEISKSILNTCPFADYNVDLDCENKCKDYYKACWKQYFERKVENGN